MPFPEIFWQCVEVDGKAIRGCPFIGKFGHCERRADECTFAGEGKFCSFRQQYTDGGNA